METIKITKADLNKNNEYEKGSIGEWDNPRNVSVEIEAGLGWVKFKELCVTGSIIAAHGSGIKTTDGGIIAGDYIDVDLGIESWGSVKADEEIKTGGDITSRWNVKAGGDIDVGGMMKADINVIATRSIGVHGNIEADGGIVSGGIIRSGGAIKAGEGIVAGGSIECKSTLSFQYKLFAGVCPWFSHSAKTVSCRKLLSGTIAYGDLIETGIPREEDAETIVLNGKTYKLVE